jgi:ankyrin repeat protein
MPSFQSLMDNGADIHHRNRFGELALHRAALTSRVQMIELLVAHGADLNAQSHVGGNTPLHLASLYAMTETVTVLLDLGAEMNIHNAAEGRTPLHVAFLSIWATINVPTLVNRGADVNAVDTRGWTSLFYAVQAHDPVLVMFLLNRGARMDARDIDGKLPVDYAEDEDVREMLQ